MKQYRDCDLKGRILRSIHQSPIGSHPTARAIFDAVGHHNFDSFLSTIHRLKKYSYISVIPDSRPFQYRLTRKGQEHAHDPYKYKKAKQQHLEQRIRAILNDDDRFSGEVEKEVRQRLSEIESGTREAPPIIETVETEADDSALKAELESKNLRIQELEAALQHLKLHQSNVPTKAAPPEKSPEEQQKENERRQRREKLAMNYRGMLLDAAFFGQWGDMLPFRMKHLQLYREGSVEIMSKSNPEIRRGHARRPLYPPEVAGARFHITKMNKNGISISGQGLPGGQTSLRW
ncbi:hypothetical protein [uncultured Methanolobus sp.]|uniref:hypothetical protein n=1 Tax=uncultured Methanolobus sp. TaxID=218300 RepID=UPI002AAB08DE|nr:hypothetical protein [uncultured Methanolobus sp.]